jgi:putative DNA primase/helicase
MDFLNFCQAHGIIISAPPPMGTWKRYPTTDHPKKRNGAVKFMGDHAFVQNHAVNTEVSVWKGEEVTFAQKRDFQMLAVNAERERVRLQRDAANRAAAILKQCVFGKHDYLKAKGFEDEHANIMVQEGVPTLVVPMRVAGHLVGCQLISNSGAKKFLYGQRTSNAEFVLDNKGPHILCEGYATGLSIRAAMKALKRRYTLHICFSAGNMEKISSTLQGGYVVADNDASDTGLSSAKKIGWPYFMPPTTGQDFNDYFIEVGLFRSSQALAKSLPIR